MSMVCLACRAELDECWRWCPECGSTLVVYRQAATTDPWGAPEPAEGAYSVEWGIDSEEQPA